jgi:Ca-activated chloride channel family protein
MIVGDIQWLTPFYALLPLILLPVAGLFAKRRGQPLSIDKQVFSGKINYKHPLFDLVPDTQPGSKKQHRWFQVMLFIWLSLMFALALAQPVRLGERLPDFPPERDIVMLVDTSISMTLKDYAYEGEKVSRLTVLKSLLSKFVAGLKGERLAMIVFAEKPYLLVPLTRDQSLLQNQLKRLSSTMVGRISALGDAITLGLKEAARNPQRKQIFVLFSDVDQSIGRVTPDAAAELALRQEIPLYSIAIGSTAEKKVLDNAREGGLIYQAVNLDLLKRIAKRTGGQSFEASDAQSIEQALSAINQLQKNDAEQQARYARTALYPYALLAAILPLMLFQLWGAIRQAVARVIE